ncbi:MAG: D-alanyl-D-alanine carboxypeptidase/D-alanyl-D-alanine-endopeptidase [Acidobacteria bacterium]|nr:D-alanyl-D-alanine carboxypeptidase/D-alanyl-D-alanine-endopeptidase [Acidobacteriota bacterium]
MQGADSARGVGTRFSERAEEILGAEQPAKGVWGVLVVDASSGDVLFAQNADRYFVPASNMKLFTTGLALATLGPDYKFRTTLESQNALEPDGKLAGPLYLAGRGDPNLSNRKFPLNGKEEFDGLPEKAIAELASQIVAAGVKDIHGDIVGDDSYFPRERYPSGWEIEDMVWEYGAPVSAIIVNDNVVALTLTPGEKEGAAVQSELSPMTADFRVDNQVVTSAAAVKADLTLTREPGSNTVTVLGTLPANSKPRKLLLAVQEPALHAAQLLKRILEEKGVVVRGVARMQTEKEAAASQKRTVLATHTSVPLSDAVKLINKISQNLHAESLLRTSAQEDCRHAPVTTPPQNCATLTSDDYASFAAKFYAAAGIAAGDVVQTDGSGLSRHDLATPRAFVALLQYAMKQNWFAAYYDSLPIASVDGTLEDRLKNSSGATRIHAKTGSVEHVRTRSGYAELPNGRRLIFSFMSNNMGSKGHEATDALDALSVAMVEEFGAEQPAAARTGNSAKK